MFLNHSIPTMCLLYNQLKNWGPQILSYGFRNRGVTQNAYRSRYPYPLLSYSKKRNQICSTFFFYNTLPLEIIPKCATRGNFSRSRGWFKTMPHFITFFIDEWPCCRSVDTSTFSYENKCDVLPHAMTCIKHDFSFPKGHSPPMKIDAIL